MEKKKQQILSRSLSMDMIADLDQDGDGVDRCEYLCGMLIQMNKVTKEDLVPLLLKFEELDEDKDGVLTQDDMILKRRQDRQAKIKRSRFDMDSTDCTDRYASAPPVSDQGP